MKNCIIYMLVMVIAICGCPVSACAAEEPELYARAAVLMDADFRAGIIRKGTG